MSKWLKIGLVLCALVVAIGVALVILIQTQLTPERVRSTLLPMAEKQLGRQVSVGDIDIGLFSGVTINDLKIMEDDPEKLFLAVDSSSLSYRLWPLLKGQLVIKEIILDQPQISVIRHADGTFNFSDLLPEQDGAAEAPEAPSAETASSSEGMVDLLIQMVAIRNGEVKFVDRLINPEAPFRYTLSRFDFEARQITLLKAFPVELSTELNGTPVTLSGQVNPVRNSGELTLRLEPLDLIPFAPYYRASIPGTLGAARLLVNVDVDWNAQKVSSQGKVVLEQVDLVLTDMPDAPLRGGRLGADYALSFDLSDELIDISTLLVQLNDIQAQVQGRLSLSPEPQLEATLNLDRLDLRQAIASLPQSLSQQVQSFSPAGELNAQVRLSGPLNAGAELVQSAQLKLLRVQATIDKLRAAISGDVAYEQQALRSDNLNLRYGDQQAALTFELNRILEQPVIGTFALTAKEVKLDTLLSQNEDEPSSSTPGTPPTSTETELGPYDLPLDITGSVRVDRLLYRRLTVQKFGADVTLKNNRLTIDPISGQVAGGTFGLSSVIDLGVRGLAYQGQLKLSQGDLATLVSGVFPLTGQQFGGQTQWVNDFSGRGTTKETLLRALQLDGQISLLQGVIAGLPLQEQIATFLDSPDLTSIDFREFQGNYRMRDGRLRLDSEMEGSKVSVTPTGTLGIDGSLELKLPVRLSPEVLSRMGASDRLKQAFVDSSGWGVLPLQIGGSLTSPKIGFDSEALQKQAVDQATQALGERLREKLAPESDDQEEGNEPLKNLLDNALRRLKTP